MPLTKKEQIELKRSITREIGSKLLSLQSHLAKLKSANVRERRLSAQAVEDETKETAKKVESLQAIANSIKPGVKIQDLRAAQQVARAIPGVPKNHALVEGDSDKMSGASYRQRLYIDASLIHGVSTGEA